MKNRLFFLLTILGSILLMAMLFFQNQAVGAEELIQPTPEADMYQLALNQLESFNSNMDSKSAQTSLNNKIQAMQSKQAVQATAQAETPLTLEQVCKSMLSGEAKDLPQEAMSAPQGIQPISEDFLADRGYLLNTLWRGDFSGYETEIYAGSLFEDRGTGILIMRIPDLEFFRVFPDPQADGKLTIAEMDGFRMQLQTANGNMRLFDLFAQEFIFDLSKGLTVVDLPPAPTPVADPCAAFSQP